MLHSDQRETGVILGYRACAQKVGFRASAIMRVLVGVGEQNESVTANNVKITSMVENVAELLLVAVMVARHNQKRCFTAQQLAVNRD